MLRLAILTTLTAAFGGVARGESCPPSARLAGDPDLVTAVARELGVRGISVALDEHCPSVSVTVTWRGTELVIAIANPDGSSTERAVSEVGTAATVIESFTRTDVAMPLLATRSIAPVPSTPPISLRDEEPAPPSPPGQRIQVSASVETAFANDRTTWLGANLKVCIQLGPICAAARYRASKVVDGLERNLDELLIGVDVPFALGRFLLSPGFAGGLGGMETHVGAMKRHTGGFRAEAQVSLSLPIANKLAIDVSIGAGLGDFDRSLVMAPLEPWGELRTGIGLRYGTR